MANSPAITEWDAQGNPVQSTNPATEWDAQGHPISSSQGGSAAQSPAHDYSSLTANPKGEGTYQIRTSDGQTVPVPYSNVPVFTQGLQGTSFASPDEQARFQKDAAADPHRPTFWNALTNPVGSGGRDQGLLGGALQFGGQAVKAMAQPFQHPAQALEGAAKTAAYLGGQGMGVSMPEAWNPATAVAQQYATDQQAGGNALALENLGGQLAGGIEGGRMMGAALTGVKPSPSLGPVNNVIPGAVERGVIPGAVGAMGDKLSSISDKAENYLRPKPSPLVVSQSEVAARNLSAAVLPASKDATNFIQAAQQEVPNILDYAKRTGNPLNTQLEFSKAAQGYAQEVRGFYENDLLGPVQNKLVRTSGTGFGSRMGEGQDTYATLGEIDKRVTAINQQLDAPAMNADDARRALASKQGLQDEAAGLRNILHQNLSDASGLTPDQVADIRQRVGRSYELANDTNAAVTQRMQSAAKAEAAPLDWRSPGKALQDQVGGPVGIADRAFQRAIARFPGQSTPLPTVNPQAAAAAPAPGLTRMQQLAAASRQQFAAARAAAQAARLRNGPPPGQ
jgi:hypothetical protein